MALLFYITLTYEFHIEFIVFNPTNSNTMETETAVAKKSSTQKKTLNVLITGSTSGIGLGIARAFAKQGHNIVFNGLEKEGPDIAAQVAKECNVGTMYSPANMLNASEINAMVDEGIKKFGSIDVLINDAGIQYVAPIEDFPEARMGCHYRN